MYFNRSDRTLLGNWFWCVDKWLLFAFLMLIFLGTFFIFSATPEVAKTIGVDKFFFIKRHFLYLIPCVLAMVFLSALDQKTVRRFCFLVFILSFFCLTLIPFIGTEIKGAKRWIDMIFFSFQPSEVMKFTFMIFSAWLLYQHEEKADFIGKEFSYLLCFSILGLLLLQPDLGMSFLIFAGWFSQVFAAGMNWIVLLFLILIGGFSMVGCYFLFPHFMMRVDKFFSTTESYQIKKSLQAFANGGFFGVGPGEGTIKRFLPDAHSDFIFSVIGEEFGTVVCVLILLIFIFIIFRVFYLALNVENSFYMYALLGITVIFAMQVIINVASSMNLMPTKGMTLPFISYGGSSYFSISLYAGIVLCFTKKTINYNKFY